MKREWKRKTFIQWPLDSLSWINFFFWLKKKTIRVNIFRTFWCFLLGRRFMMGWGYVVKFVNTHFVQFIAWLNFCFNRFAFTHLSRYQYSNFDKIDTESPKRVQFNNLWINDVFDRNKSVVPRDQSSLAHTVRFQFFFFAALDLLRTLFGDRHISRKIWKSWNALRTIRKFSQFWKLYLCWVFFFSFLFFVVTINSRVVQCC